MCVLSRSTCTIFQIPLNVGQPYIGTCSAPQQLMEGGLVNTLTDLGWRIDIADPHMFDQSKYSSSGYDNHSNPKNCRIAGQAMKDIEEGIVSYAKKDNFLLMLGGDHCIPIGTIAAVKRARPNTAVVWVDAHADINTPATSSSGNLHGMPLAFLLGLVENVNSLPSFEYFEPCLSPSDIVYVGLRDVDKGEKEIIKKLGIKAFTVRSEYFICMRSHCYFISHSFFFSDARYRPSWHWKGDGHVCRLRRRQRHPLVFRCRCNGSLLCTIDWNCCEVWCNYTSHII